jgi:preprotein translocase SecE subunit
MADDKAKQGQRDDPRTLAAKQRAAALTRSNPATPEQVGQFIKETIGELKKTTWPDQNTLVKSTGIVLAFILLTAVWVGILDFILTRVTAPLFGTS